MTATPAAVLLDVDGTLLDTNYLHVQAWWEAFLAAGEQVSCFDIGRGSDDLVRQLIGRGDDGIADGHSERWAPLRKKMIPFHRAAELVRECAGRGLRRGPGHQRHSGGRAGLPRQAGRRATCTRWSTAATSSGASPTRRSCRRRSRPPASRLTGP